MRVREWAYEAPGLQPSRPQTPVPEGVQSVRSSRRAHGPSSHPTCFGLSLDLKLSWGSKWTSGEGNSSHLPSMPCPGLGVSGC